ncbi:hypothetical protein LOAG_08994 [Loa loa]|uniref:Uncharacterized protein n=1 Tax=Loa loa TaxID=7209 RepID=A0A1S0TSY3_LOALO|nr:hypothetical protein LOAG_08994 [Loa loa]EFO19499.1 hypothetical protein LOAG_08994 [Loa loa]
MHVRTRYLHVKQHHVRIERLQQTICVDIAIWSGHIEEIDRRMMLAAAEYGLLAIFVC